MIGYLNVNNLRNKIIDLREITLDYVILSETKTNDSFPTVQFDMSGYETRARRDRDGMGGGGGGGNNRICKKGTNLQKTKRF